MMKRIPKSLKSEYRLTHDDDSWSNCLSWHFAVCDYLLLHGHPIPDEWGFHAGLGYDDKSYEYKVIKRARLKVETLTHFGHVLCRLAKILKAQGKNY